VINTWGVTLSLGPEDRREREKIRKWFFFLFSKPNEIKTEHGFDFQTKHKHNKICAAA
jgi:hypothetical protein